MKSKLGLTIIIILLIGLMCSSCSNILTDEERAERSAPKHYSVCSVSQYIKTRTGRFGDVVDQKTAYTFTYIDESGSLHQLDNFIPTEYGIFKLQIGDKDEYVTTQEANILYLTESTLSNINMIGE